MPDRNLEKLLGGYATHTLTEEERRALFPTAVSGTKGGGLEARVVSGTRYVVPLAPPQAVEGQWERRQRNKTHRRPLPTRSPRGA